MLKVSTLDAQTLRSMSLHSHWFPSLTFFSYFSTRVVIDFNKWLKWSLSGSQMMSLKIIFIPWMNWHIYAHGDWHNVFEPCLIVTFPCIAIHKGLKTHWNWCIQLHIALVVHWSSLVPNALLASDRVWGLGF